MQGKKQTSIGKKYNKLTVISEIKDIHNGNSRIRYVCSCDCGNTKIVLPYNLKHNQAKACDNCKFSRRGLTKSNRTFYARWGNMIRRCNNKSNPHYKNYGGRGIKVCREWYNFLNFYDDMFPTFKIGLSLDRIDNNGNYCKENCRWTTQYEQGRNQRSNIRVIYKGKEMILVDIATLLKIKPSSMYSRYRRGWRDDKLFQKVV